MSKCFLIGDIHLGINQIYLDKWLNIHNKYFNEYFLPLLKQNYVKGDCIFILGNLFNNKNSINFKILTFTLNLFDIFENLDYKIIIISGENESLNDSPLKIFDRYKNIKIIKEATNLIINNKNILLLPWDKSTNQLKEIKNQRLDYLFCTMNLKGAKINNSKYITNGNNIGDLINIKYIYSGSNNYHQTIENFKYIGNPLHMNNNDINNIKGIYMIDLNNDKEIFLENNTTPIFKNIEINSEEDIINLENEKYNFINLTINNDLYKNINYRRRIEEYNSNNINEINFISNKVKIESINIDIDVDLALSTEDLIREYIKNQECDENIKNDYIKIFEDTLKIIDRNEKNKNG